MNKIIESGKFFYRNAFSPNPQSGPDTKHMHDCFELYYIIQGDADYIIDDSILHLQENDVLFIRPSVYHHLKLLSNAPYHRIVINFTSEDIDPAFISDLDRLQIRYCFPAESLINQYYGHCIQIEENYSEEDALPCLKKLLNLMIKELKYGQQYANKEEVKIINPLFSKIIKHINNHIEQPLNTTSLAKEFSISPSWIMHSFRKFLNISVMDYINHKKILHAQQLIKNGAPPMEVSKQCGFENYSTFYMLYKKIIGVNPAKSK